MLWLKALAGGSLAGETPLESLAGDSDWVEALAEDSGWRLLLETIAGGSHWRL